jgi:Lrp/AsnC family leucine-responsive transcriptional regulator
LRPLPWRAGILVSEPVVASSEPPGRRYTGGLRMVPGRDRGMAGTSMCRPCRSVRAVLRRPQVSGRGCLTRAPGLRPGHRARRRTRSTRSTRSVRWRGRRLERAGVITGYRVDVDLLALGLPVTAFARVRPAPGQLHKVAELAAALPQVSECHRITGEDCFLVKVHAPTVELLEDVLDRFLLYGQTVTSIVVSTPVPTRPLPLNAAQQKQD